MSCANKVIVFSGFRDDSLKAQIEAAGGKVATSIIKASTHLIINPDGKASKKIDEAKEKGLTINFLDDFITEFGFTLAPKAPKAPKEPKEPKAPKAVKAEPAPKAEPNTDMELLCELMNALNTKTRSDKTLAAIEEITKRIKAF
jgi:hypothetical protein